MSLSVDGIKINCDGLNCLASARVPIGLSSLLGNPAKPAGWLYVSAGGQHLHYCPKCAPGVIRKLQDADWPANSSAARP